MALNKTLSFDLELKPGGIPPIIHASQGDIGRMFKANIYWDGSAATSYVSGATVNLRGKKPDKTVFDYSATLAGSMVTFETTEQMTIISGPVECELVFSQGGDVIASANFVLIVEASPYDPNALSESVIPSIGDLIEETIGGDVRDEVQAELEAHPEWTTTVQDGAITAAKIATSFLPEIENAYVTPEMFGAKGDGTTDDTAAFKNMCAANDGTPVVLNGTYFVKGDAVFSYLDNPREKTNMFVYGHDSTIIWDSENTTNSLFKLNLKVWKIVLNGLTIKCKNNHGYIFNYYGNTMSDIKAAATCSHIYDVSLREYATGQVYFPDYVFYIHGYGHCDQMLVEKCDFTYFYNFYYCENAEAVNNTFLACGFFTTQTNAVYFEFDEMYDNFNVENCALSLYAGQTLLKNTYNTNPNNFYFNFTNNRYELYGTGTYIQLVDTAYGIINFTGENFTLGGFSTKENRIATTENAICNFTNCYFGHLSVSIGPITASVLSYGKMHGFFTDCAFNANPSITYAANISKKVVFKSCDFPGAKNLTYSAYAEGRYSAIYGGDMYTQSFSSLVNLSFPPLYYAERVRIRRLTQAGSTQTLTVTINGTDYSATLGTDPGSEAVIPFTGIINTISTNKNILFNIIVETSTQKLAT